MTTPPGPGLHQRVGFAIGLRISRALRAVHFTRKPLQIVPRYGPWIMRYLQENGLRKSGLRIAVGTSEVAVSGGRKGHPGTIVGLRWRLPRPTDWDREWEWPRQRGTELL